MLSSGKLYVDSYTEDMFGYNTSGCVDISYAEMKQRDLLKEFKVDGVTCASADTFIRVRKSNDHYTYETSIVCTDKSGNVVYEQKLANSCSDAPDEDGPIIVFDKNGTTSWTKGVNLTTKVKIYDDYGMLENTKIKYVWVVNGVEQGTKKTHDFQNKRYEGTYSNPLVFEVDVPQNVTGNYYLKVEPVDVRDANGNYQLSTKTSNAFMLDNTAPTCAGDDGSNIWTSESRRITVECSDSHSGCKKESYLSQTYESGTVLTGQLKIADNVGNERTCTYNVYVDKEAPQSPKNCSIGEVSGSSTTGNIKTKCAATSDVNNGSGFKEIRYIIKNESSTPKKSEFTSTSSSFTRSCGTKYCAYAVAVDNVGNTSSVYVLGCTSDKKSEYGSWTACDADCGGGTKYQYNLCELKIDDYNSESCNTQACPEPEPEYPVNDCNIRGSTKRTQSYTWTCTCGKTHSTGYTHYCTDSNGNLYTRDTNKSLVKFSWVCPISPYGPAQGWTVIDD